MELHKKIKRKLDKLRFQPIRVFCIHHISDEFDSSSMKKGDWMQTAIFKQCINDLAKDGYKFISLENAYKKLKQDIIRAKKYAVITFDDGYLDILDIIPWLEAKHIPVTLFINGKYLDGMSYRDSSNEKYLTTEELFSLNSQLIEVASHGWEHTSVYDMTENGFAQSIELNRKLLSRHSRYIRFYAYPYGNKKVETDEFLLNSALVPVLINGGMNYCNTNYIDRELMKL